MCVCVGGGGGGAGRGGAGRGGGGGRVKLKRAFEHSAQNAQIQINLRICKVSSGPLI